MAELWGFQAGQQQAQEYTQQQSLFNLQMQEGGMKLESDKVSLETQKLGLAQQQMMMDLLRRRAAGQQTRELAQSGQKGALPGTGSGMEELALKAEEDGDIQAASGELDKASSSYERAATIRHNASEIEKNSHEMEEKKLGRIASLAQAAKEKIAADPEHAQQIWQSANMQYMASEGEQSQFASMPYSAELLSGIIDSAQTMQQRAATKAAAAREKASAAVAAEAKARIPLINATRRVEEMRADALAQGGTLAPKASTVTAVKHYIGANYDMNPDELDIQSRAIAEDAERRVKRDHLNQSEAVAAAYRAADKNGSFRGAPRTKPDLGTRTKPRDVPTDPKLMKDNQFYKLGGAHKGEIGMWSAKDNGFVPAAAMQRTPEEEDDTSDAGDEVETEEP